MYPDVLAFVCSIFAQALCGVAAGRAAETPRFFLHGCVLVAIAASHLKVGIEGVALNPHRK